MGFVALHCSTLLFKSNGIYFSNAHLVIYIINILKQAFNMTLIRCFMRMKWNFICLWLFVASIRPFKISKVWKTRYQNAWNWDSFWWLFHYTPQIAMGTQIISISWDRNEACAWNHCMCFGSWNKINPFITKCSQNRQFWNTLITVGEIPYPYYDLWNNKADIVILSFNNEWVLLVHWWERQAAVEGSALRGDERTPDMPPAKPWAQPSEAARHFEVELRQHWRLV